MPIDAGTTKSCLIQFCAETIFIASAFHSAVNYSQVDFGANIFCMPGMILRPPLNKKGLSSVDEDYIMGMLPPKKWAIIQLGVLLFLSQPSSDRLGIFLEDWWGADAGAQEAVARFRGDLRVAGKIIEARNDPLSYSKGTCRVGAADTMPPRNAIRLPFASSRTKLNKYMIKRILI